MMLSQLLTIDPNCHALDTDCTSGQRLQGVGLPIAHTWGIARERRAYDEARAILGHVLHADITAVNMSSGGAGLVLCSANDYLGLVKATAALTENGVLIVCGMTSHSAITNLTNHSLTNSSGVLAEFGTDKQLAARHLTGACFRLFELMDMGIIIGLKRESFSNSHQTWRIEQSHSSAVGQYHCPESRGFSVFERTRPPTEELREIAVQFSKLPMRDHSEQIANRPIMPLSSGHMGMVLASGMLDGLITLASGEVVCIKGISQKEQYKASEEIVDLDDKTQQRKTVYSERAVLKIRTINQEGNLVGYETEREQ